MKKAISILTTIYRVFLVILTAIIVILGIYQVLGRYLQFLHWSTSWTEEAMRYIYVGIIMLGLACVTRDGSFTTITVLSDFVQKKTRIGGAVLYVFQNLVQIACFAMLFYLGLKLALSAGNRVSATTLIPFNIIYAPIPIGSFLAMAFTALRMIEPLLHRKSNVEGGADNG